MLNLLYHTIPLIPYHIVSYSLPIYLLYYTTQYTTPCNTIPFHALPCNTMQHHTILCNTIPYNTIPCNTIPSIYHTMQHHTTCNTIPYHAIPCHAVPYHIALQDPQNFAFLTFLPKCKKKPNKMCHIAGI